MATFIGIKGALGKAGALSRGTGTDFTVEAKAAKAGETIADGVPVKLNADGTVSKCTAQADVVYGISVRGFHQPERQEIVSVLRRGYVFAVVSGEAPARNQALHLTASGDFAKAGGTACALAVTTGEYADGLAEVAFNL